jgi:hypothetical protein
LSGNHMYDGHGKNLMLKMPSSRAIKAFGSNMTEFIAHFL